MRAVNRFPFRKVYFRRPDTTLHGIHEIRPGLERVFWNSEKRAIVEKITRPLAIILTPHKWSVIARQHIPADDWLVDAGEQTEEVDVWMN